MEDVQAREGHDHNGYDDVCRVFKQLIVGTGMFQPGSLKNQRKADERVCEGFCRRIQQL